MTDQNALFQLGAFLQESGYSFTTVTPVSHARVLGRTGGEQTGYCEAEGRDLRDIFGWNKPFERAALPTEIFSLLEACGAIEHAVGAFEQSPMLRSRVRFSTLGRDIFVHSAYPTKQADSVFFGPDTYRFVYLIEREVARIESPLDRIVDIGCGAGPGGIAAARKRPNCALVLADINILALKYAEVNARLAGLSNARTIQSDLYAALEETFDLIVSNPPYLLDAEARTYRHGGGKFGSSLSKQIVVEGLPRLAPGGTLILYTGAPIVHGRDVFLESLMPELEQAGMDYRYCELDPDVFGEELENPGYEDVDRIAAVALVVKAKA